MRSGPIERMPRHRVDSRRDHVLPTAWVRTEGVGLSRTGGAWLVHSATPQLGAGEEPLLAMLGRDPDAAAAVVVEAARSGRRTYVLVGPGWAGGETAKQLAKAPRVLLRRVPEVPASAIHCDGEAQLWLGGGYGLRLDATQAANLRQTFLRLFWHDATEESWSGEPQLIWRAAKDRPFDVPDVPSSALLRIVDSSAQLPSPSSNGVLHRMEGLPPERPPRRLWCPAGPNHHNRLAALARAGTAITWQERGLPDILVEPASGEVLLPGSQGRLRVALTSDQRRAVLGILERDGSWVFRAGVRIGDDAHRQAQFWLPGQPTARGLSAEQRLPLSDVLADTLRSVPDTEPPTWPSADPLALAARYEWTVVPPAAPLGCSADALVGAWGQVDSDWKTRLETLRSALDAAEGDRSRIGRAFSRLMGAMMGFQRTRDGLLKTVEALESRRPSATGPEGASDLLRQLAEAEEKARKLEADLEEAERKAREDEERDKQRAGWQARLDAAKRDLPLRRQELVSAEGERAQLGDQLSATEEELKAAEKSTKKDLKARQRKLSDDLQRANRSIKRLKGEVEALEQQVAEPFTFRPPANLTKRASGGGGRFVPQRSKVPAGTPVPQEALPEVGELRSRKAERYLVIARWEDLDAGEQVAARLSARLVAPEGT